MYPCCHAVTSTFGNIIASTAAACQVLLHVEHGACCVCVCVQSPETDRNQCRMRVFLERNAQQMRCRRRQDRNVQSAEPSEAGSGGAPTGTSSGSTVSGEQRHSRRQQQPRPGSAPAAEPRPADPPVQPEGSGVMLRAAVQAASNSRPHSVAHSQTASAPGSRHASPGKSAPKTLAPGPRRTPARRPASAAPDVTGQQLQARPPLCKPAC